MFWLKMVRNPRLLHQAEWYGKTLCQKPTTGMVRVLKPNRELLPKCSECDAHAFYLQQTDSILLELGLIAKWKAEDAEKNNPTVYHNRYNFGHWNYL